MLENASSDPLFSENNEEPHVDTTDVQQLVSIFISVVILLHHILFRFPIIPCLTLAADIRAR